LYVKLISSTEADLEKAVKETLQAKYPGVDLQKMPSGEYQVIVPDSYHNGHEAHFAQVTERFLEYYQNGKMPAWEVPNMITKYYTTILAREFALK
jgi:hypothetical protein